MSKLFIQKAAFGDIEISANLFYEVFTTQEWNFTWLTVEKAKNYFTDLFNTPNFIGFLLLEDEEIIGACFGIANTNFINNQYEIKEIFVRPNLQGKGMGSLFLEEVEKNLISMGYDLITLYTQKTIKAYDFYKNKEYVDLKDTAHLMKLL